MIEILLEELGRDEGRGLGSLSVYSIINAACMAAPRVAPCSAGTEQSSSDIGSSLASSSLRRGTLQQPPAKTTCNTTQKYNAHCTLYTQTVYNICRDCHCKKKLVEFIILVKFSSNPQNCLEHCCGSKPAVLRFCLSHLLPYLLFSHTSATYNCCIDYNETGI